MAHISNGAYFDVSEASFANLSSHLFRTMKMGGGKPSELTGVITVATRGEISGDDFAKLSVAKPALSKPIYQRCKARDRGSEEHIFGSQEAESLTKSLKTIGAFRQVV